MKAIIYLIKCFVFVIGAIPFYIVAWLIAFLIHAHERADEHRYDAATDESNVIWELLREKVITRSMVEDNPDYPGLAVLRWKKGTHHL